MKPAAALICAILCEPGVSAATEFVLQLPLGAKETYSKVEKTLPALVPVGRFTGTEVPKERAPKHIRRTVWVMGGEQTVGEVQAGILSQLERAGYDPLLFCVSKDCGGFDFRFGIDVVDEPMMRVDLRNYRFISAKQTVTENPAYVTFLLSKSPVSVYVQMTEYRAVQTTGQVAVAKTPLVKPTVPDSGPKTFGDVSVVLEGLTFETGSTKLGADPQGAVAALAAKLVKEPELKVLLVGHSDMSGSLSGNIAISKKRAESVRQVLIREHGIAAARLSAHGVGFLSPRADNETDAGKQKNRRVEAVFSR